MGDDDYIILNPKLVNLLEEFNTSVERLNTHLTAICMAEKLDTMQYFAAVTRTIDKFLYMAWTTKTAQDLAAKIRQDPDFDTKQPFYTSDAESIDFELRFLNTMIEPRDRYLKNIRDMEIKKDPEKKPVAKSEKTWED